MAMASRPANCVRRLRPRAHTLDDGCQWCFQELRLRRRPAKNKSGKPFGLYLLAKLEDLSAIRPYKEKYRSSGAAPSSKLLRPNGNPGKSRRQ